MSNLKVTISRSNKKMDAIPSISFPPVTTCNHCEKCCKKCYALRMAKLRPAVATSWENNLTIWKNNPDAVKYAILNASITASYFRYFVGGDIPDSNFLKLMVEIAKTVKTCHFLAFTKQFEIVNDFLSGGGKIPKNLKIIFSEWGAPVPNPYNLPESAVIFKGQEAPEKALICGGNCCECICQGVGCWQLKKGEKIYFYEH